MIQKKNGQDKKVKIKIDVAINQNTINCIDYDYDRLN